MKQNTMQKIQDCLCIILNHLLFIAVAITILDLFQVDGIYLFPCILLVVVPLCLYFIRKKVPILVPPPLFFVILAAMYFAEKIIAKNDWSIYYYIIAFAYLMGYFTYYFTKKFLDFLKLNQNTASNIPAQNIFKNGMGLTALFSACSSIILLVSTNVDWVKMFADKIWSGIRAILYYIFSGIKTNPPIDGKEEFTQGDPQLGGANMNQVISEQTLEGIRNLMIALFCVAIIIGLTLFLYYVYYVIKGWEASDRRKKTKDKLAEDEDVREYCGIEKRSSKKVGSFLFRSNREKVRRLYQKTVTKHKKEILGEKELQYLKYLTAKECCDKLAEQQLKLVYEKARYSEEEISNEDVRLAR